MSVSGLQRNKIRLVIPTSKQCELYCEVPHQRKHHVASVTFTSVCFCVGLCRSGTGNIAACKENLSSHLWCLQNWDFRTVYETYLSCRCDSWFFYFLFFCPAPVMFCCDYDASNQTQNVAFEITARRGSKFLGGARLCVYQRAHSSGWQHALSALYHPVSLPLRDFIKPVSVQLRPTQPS